MDFPLRKASSPPTFSRDVSNMVWNDSSFGTPTTSLVMHVCHFPDFIIRAFPEIQPTVFLFSDFKEDSISNLSCQMGNPTVNSSEFDCDIRVSNGNPTFHSEIQFPPRFRILRIMHSLPDLTEVPLLEPIAAGPQISFEVGSLQGLLAKNPLEPHHLSKTLFLSRSKYSPHTGESQRSRSRWMSVGFWRKLAEHQRRIGWGLSPFFENSFALFLRPFHSDTSLNWPLWSNSSLYKSYSIAVH